MTPAWIGLGANLGDAATTVGAAITALDGLPGTRVLQASRLYVTPAWGNEDQPPFVNAVAAVETSLAADELLQAMLALEQRFGRVRDAAVHWGRARWTWTCCCMARRCSTSPACRYRTLHARACLRVGAAGRNRAGSGHSGHGRVRDAVMRVDACGIAPIG